MANIILILTIVSTALITGLYYGYACSVNPGLGKLSNREYVAAMQSINDAIQNPVFFATFFGTLILLPLSTYLHYTSLQSTKTLLLLAATAIYLIGSFGITVLGNVPLNETLAALDLKTASLPEIDSARTQFESSWNNLHYIRTVASVVSLVLVIIAAME